MPFTPQNFQDKVGPVVSAAWLNQVDVLANFVFGGATTNVQARAALCSDAPLEVANGGTGATNPATALSNLGGINLGAITQSVVGAALYPQTAGEAAVPAPLGPVVPVAPWYPPGDVRRYGWTQPGTGPANTNALNQAIVSAIPQGSSQGALITLPAGTYQISEGDNQGNPIVVAPGIAIRGAGKRATYLAWNTTGEVGPVNLFNVGAANVNCYGCALSDFSIIHTGMVGYCIYVVGTIGAEISRIYIEGETRVAGRTNVGVVLDGGNVSSFFNRFSDIECNHMHNAFLISTTGTQPSTQNYYVNCNGTGDRLVNGLPADTTSVGVLLGNGSVGAGNYSVFNNCEFENYGTALHITSISGNCTFVGFRTESNTTDYQFDANSNGSTFIGCNPSTIVDSQGSAEQNLYIGCTNGSGVPTTSQFLTALFLASTPTGVPIITQGYPGQTGAQVQVKNSAGTVNFQVNVTGAVGMWGQPPPASRTNGYGTPTGGGVQGSFAAGSITLPNLAAAVAQLINDVKATGLIGS